MQLTLLIQCLRKKRKFLICLLTASKQGLFSDNFDLMVNQLYMVRQDPVPCCKDNFFWLTNHVPMIMAEQALLILLAE